MTGLDFLLLANTKVSDAGMQTVGALQNLTALNLRGTQVGDAGMESIGRLPKLQWLVLVDTGVGNAGLDRLAGVKTLENLYLSKESKATQAGIDCLKAVLPKVKITLSEGY